MTDDFSKINPTDPLIIVFPEQKQSTEVVCNVVTFEEQKVVVKAKVGLEIESDSEDNSRSLLCQAVSVKDGHERGKEHCSQFFFLSKGGYRTRHR
jgi:hypothetical protein